MLGLHHCVVPSAATPTSAQRTHRTDKEVVSCDRSVVAPSPRASRDPRTPLCYFCGHGRLTRGLKGQVGRCARHMAGTRRAPGPGSKVAQNGALQTGASQPRWAAVCGTEEKTCKMRRSLATALGAGSEAQALGRELPLTTLHGHGHLCYSTPPRRLSSPYRRESRPVLAPSRQGLGGPNQTVYEVAAIATQQGRRSGYCHLSDLGKDPQSQTPGRGGPAPPALTPTLPRLTLSKLVPPLLLPRPASLVSQLPRLGSP